MNGETKAIVLIHGLWMTPRSWELSRIAVCIKGG